MNRFIKIITWLGIMAVLTLLAMGVWVIVFQGSQSTESLKWFQFLQTLATFLLPPILCAWIWDADHRPFSWLKLDTLPSWQTCLIAIAVMVCAIPAINLLADLNGRIRLPGSWAALELRMRQMEDAAAALTERFLQADNIGTLMINLGLMALLPALAEELSFRGTLQQILDKGQGDKVQSTKESGSRVHIAIWVTAFIFSAIHMQFYGFIPRMLMGAMFGYIFVWTGSLWVPVLMHFTNNGLAVLAYYLEHSVFGSALSDTNINADTIGAGDTWYIGLISLCVVGALLYLLTSRDLLRYGRRTRKE